MAAKGTRRSARVAVAAPVASLRAAAYLCSPMQTRQLGRTSVRLTEITLGTWGLAAGSYGPVAPARFEATVQGALDAGVRSFDMSPLWGEDGASERVVGRLTKSLRDECTYITRGGVERTPEGVHSRFDRESLVRDCEASLARLGTERLDLLLWHHPSEATLRGPDFHEAGAQLMRQGKTRAWGVTVSTSLEARLAIAAGAQAICVVYNLLSSDLLDDLLANIVVSGTGVLVRSPLAYGLLAGTFARAQRFAADDHRARRWEAATLSKRVGAVEELRFLVQDSVKSPADAALRWVLSNTLISSCIVGARTPAQASAAAAASVGVPYLPEDALARVPQVLAALGL